MVDMLTLATAIRAEKIIGAIQWTIGGPKLVHANPNRPIVRSGAATGTCQQVTDVVAVKSITHYIAANITGLPVAGHLGRVHELCSAYGSRGRKRNRP